MNPRIRTKELVKLCGIGRMLRKIRTAYFALLRITGNSLGALLRGPHSSIDREKIRNILIIRLDRIGDLILSTPAIRATKENFPYSKLTLVVNAYTKNLVVNNAFVDTLLTYSSGRLRQTIRRIRAEKPDLAIVLSPGLLGACMAYWSRAPYRVGYDSQGAGLFLTHMVRDDRATRMRHEVETALEIVGLAGCRTDNKELEVSVTKEGEIFAESFVSDNNLKSAKLIVGIHPGSRQPYIRWKKEGFAEVADTLFEKYGAKIIIFGSESEQSLINEVTVSMKHKPITAAGLTLTKLVSLIKRCNLFISNSTGPMHIAAALKVPVVAVFGNKHPLDSFQEWGPWGKNTAVVHKDPGCSYCHPSDCDSFKCMDLVLPEDVVTAAEKILKKVG